mmetsp:Transcript_5528/g.12121  ORF Transcript_5528/g.12121 Transcript_5528/m.12121 type:complete len:490 (-) Transcript_5528:1012-2481(-)
MSIFVSFKGWQREVVVPIEVVYCYWVGTGVLVRFGSVIASTNGLRAVDNADAGASILCIAPRPLAAGIGFKPSPTTKAQDRRPEVYENAGPVLLEPLSHPQEFHHGLAVARSEEQVVIRTPALFRFENQFLAFVDRLLRQTIPGFGRTDGLGGNHRSQNGGSHRGGATGARRRRGERTRTIAIGRTRFHRDNPLASRSRRRQKAKRQIHGCRGRWSSHTRRTAPVVVAVAVGRNVYPCASVQECSQNIAASASYGHVNRQPAAQIGNLHCYFCSGVAQKHLGCPLCIVVGAVMERCVSTKTRMRVVGVVRRKLVVLVIVVVVLRVCVRVCRGSPVVLVVVERWTGTPRRQIRPPLQEEARRLGCILLGGKAQGRGSAVGLGIDLRPLAGQEFDAGGRVAVGGIVQGRPSGGMGPGVGIGIVLEQECHAFGFVLEGGPVEGRVAVAIGASDGSQEGMAGINGRGQGRGGVVVELVPCEVTGPYQRGLGCF